MTERIDPPASAPHVPFVRYYPGLVRKGEKRTLVVQWWNGWSWERRPLTFVERLRWVLQARVPRVR